MPKKPRNPDESRVDLLPRCPSATRRRRPTSCCRFPASRSAPRAATIKNWQRDDVLLAVFDAGTIAAGVFTQNRFCAAPVQVCRRHLAQSGAHPRARRQRRQRERRHRRGRHRRGGDDLRRGRVAARLRGAPGAAVLDRRDHGAAAGREDRRRAAGREGGAGADHWFAAVSAIMTTDTVPKGASRRVAVDGVPVTVTGIAKGAGMIHPDMATMLSFVATDAPIAAALLAPLTREIADVSFNCATVDGDTSTNDSFVIAATGRAPIAPIARADDPRLAPIRAALTDVGDRARAGDRPRRRGRDQVHDDPGRGRARRRRVPADRARHRPFAARQDRVLRVGSRTSAASSARSAMPPRRISMRRACRSGSTTCWSSTTAAAPLVSRGGRPARDEARRDHGARRAAAAATRRRRSGPAISRTITSASTPTTGADVVSASELGELFARLESDPRARRGACCRRRRRRRTGARPRFAGASAPAAATCRRSRIRTRSASTISSRSTSRSMRSTPTRGSSSPGCRRTTCC